MKRRGNWTWWVVAPCCLCLVLLGWYQITFLFGPSFVADSGVIFASSTTGFDEEEGDHPSPPLRRPRSDQSRVASGTNIRQSPAAKRRSTEKSVPSAVAASATDNKDRGLQPPLDSVAACLVVMDDNHWLIEWLAYHYHVLPLRSLIVVQDPHSKTSPLPVLDRWKNRMNITIWKDEQFVKPWILRTYKAGRMEQFRLHRFRQQFFYPACLKAFQSQRQEWVLLVDTDELVRPNPYYYEESAAGAAVSSSPPLSNYSVEAPGAVLSALRDYERYARQSPACLHIPRLQMSGRRDEDAASDRGTGPAEGAATTSVTVPPPFNASHFLTTSWFYHAGKAISTGHANLDGKNVVHVQRVSAPQIPSRAKTVHHVLPSVCPVKVATSQSPLAIHHYLGTLEQFTSRTDPRDAIPNRPARDEALYGKYVGAVRDASLVPWLAGFVADVGIDEARLLLEGVGVVERPLAG